MNMDVLAITRWLHSFQDNRVTTPPKGHLTQQAERINSAHCQVPNEPTECIVGGFGVLLGYEVGVCLGKCT